jgi:polar amino acid transport system substrate-binding protein
MKKQLTVLTILLLFSLILAACGGGEGDLLDEVKSRGYLVVSTDPNYEPQSFLDPNGERAADTVCPDDLLTYGEMVGFDVDTAKGVADALGVDVCFATPDWDIVTAGNWGDRWDISIGSMTITTARQEILNFAHPYYYTPAQFAAAADAGITTWDDLVDQPVCVATATTYVDWLNGDLGIPDSSIYTDPPAGITYTELPTDQECAQAIAAGRPEFSVYLTSGTVVDSNIADGLDVVKVGGVVFSEELAPAIDKNSSFDTAAFEEAVSDAIAAMHDDGTLSNFSMEWFGIDLTQDPTQ